MYTLASTGGSLFKAILEFISSGIGSVFEFVSSIFTGGVGMFYGADGLTDMGELALFGVMVGAAWLGIRWVGNMIRGSVR